MPIYDYQRRGCGQQFELLVLKATVGGSPARRARVRNWNNLSPASR